VSCGSGWAQGYLEESEAALTLRQALNGHMFGKSFQGFLKSSLCGKQLRKLGIIRCAATAPALDRAYLSELD
jgi:hypothetical protein